MEEEQINPDERFDAIDKRFDAVDRRFDRIEAKLDHLIRLVGQTNDDS